LEAGTKRQKHSDVVVDWLPADNWPISMADVLGKVLSAFAASGVLVPSALLSDLHTAGVEIGSPNDEAVFLEALVQLYVAPNPGTVTIGNERVVLTRGVCSVGQYPAARQVVHAVDEVSPACATPPDTPLGNGRVAHGSPLLPRRTLRPGHFRPLLRCGRHGWRPLVSDSLCTRVVHLSMYAV
jgi:hypothetical protein